MFKVLSNNNFLLLICMEPMDIDIDNIDKIKQRLSKELIGVSEDTEQNN